MGKLLILSQICLNLSLFAKMYKFKVTQYLYLIRYRLCSVATASLDLNTLICLSLEKLA